MTTSIDVDTENGEEYDPLGDMGEKQKGGISKDSDETDIKPQTEAKYKHSTPQEVSNQRSRSFSTSDISAIVLDLTGDDGAKRPRRGDWDKPRSPHT